MTCMLFCCAGSGPCSMLLSFVVSLTFTLHAFGAASPQWMCNGNGCTPEGLYYTCSNSAVCSTGVNDSTIVALVVLVLASSLAMTLILCFILSCTNYRYGTLKPTLAFFIGAWFLVQEILSIVIIARLAINYDTIGWSAYVFSISGIVGLGVVIFILIYMSCSGSKSVHPTV